MKHYVFRPRSLVTAIVHAEWKALHAHMQRAPGFKYVALWCTIPPGLWDMRDVTIARWSLGGPP